MTDNLRTWLEERETIHGKANRGKWVASDPAMWGDDNDTPQSAVISEMHPITWDDHSGEVFKPEDASAIVDAHNTLPKLLRGVRAVLELHSEDVYGECSSCVTAHGAGIPYPCPTVQKLQEAINDAE